MFVILGNLIIFKLFIAVAFRSYRAYTREKVANANASAPLLVLLCRNGDSVSHTLSHTAGAVAGSQATHCAQRVLPSTCGQGNSVHAACSLSEIQQAGVHAINHAMLLRHRVSDTATSAL